MKNYLHKMEEKRIDLRNPAEADPEEYNCVVAGNPVLLIKRI